MLPDWLQSPSDSLRESLGWLSRSLPGVFRRVMQAVSGAKPDFLGAEPDAGGTAFRVWAPGAAAVEVAGDFSAGPDGRWLERRHPMSRMADGYWDTYVVGAKVGHRYKYRLLTADGRWIWRMDPAARDTLHSAVDDQGNAGLIVNPAYAWRPFRRPRRDELIVYQLHVGAFSGRNDGAPGPVGTFDDLRDKLDYIADMNFTAIELTPVQEFTGDRSWGYNPSFYFAPESAFGSPVQMRRLVDTAHKRGLAVIFDVVYNHVSNTDNPLWDFDGSPDEGGVYLQRFKTPWSDYAPAYWKPQVREFFLRNALMYLEEYHADGLRFDATRNIEFARGLDDDGWGFLQHLTWNLRQQHPDAFLVAEHLPDHPSIVDSAGFDATWVSEAHHDFERALIHGPSDATWPRLLSLLGRDLGPDRRYAQSHAMVKFLLGSHDDCGDDRDGASIDAAEEWLRHRFMADRLGGRGDWRARAKARLAWALNVTMMGTPMLFMGNECLHDGYWHDRPDTHGDHRFDWSLTEDRWGREMRELVSEANRLRREHPALRGETLEPTHEHRAGRVFAFKRWLPGGSDALLTVVNLSDTTWSAGDYRVGTGGQPGSWREVLNTQEERFGGWPEASNGGRSLVTGDDGRVAIVLPAWSVVVLELN
jgi:1,4-alpha-glucan branching enzyme